MDDVKIESKNEGIAHTTPPQEKEKIESKNVIEALVKAQLHIKAPKKNGVNPMFKNRYATYEDIVEAVRLPLANEGLTLYHTTTGDGQTLLTRLYHISGQYLENVFPMKVEKPNSQGMASANTYAKRQSICNLLGLAGDEDDDANAACKNDKQTLTEEQTEVLEEYIAGDAAITERILKGYKVKSLADLPTKNYAAVLNGVKKLGKNKEAKI